MFRRDQGVSVHPLGELRRIFGVHEGDKLGKKVKCEGDLIRFILRFDTTDRPFQSVHRFIAFRGIGNDCDIARFDDGVEIASDRETHITDRFHRNDRLDRMAPCEGEGKDAVQSSLFDAYESSGELIACAGGEERSTENSGEVFRVVARFGETVDKLAVEFVETVKGGDEFARIRGEFRPSSPFAACETINERLIGEGIHSVDPLPRRFVAHFHLFGGGVDRSRFIDPLEQFDPSGT